MKTLNTIVPIRTITPDNEVVEKLEELLARAKTGEIQTLTFVSLNAEKYVEWGNFGKEAITKRMYIASVLQWLQNKLISQWEIDVNP